MLNRNIFSKVLTIVLCLTLVFALAACGGSQPNDNGDDPDNGGDIVDPNGLEPIDVVSDTVKDIILQVVLFEVPWTDNIYFEEDLPDNPEQEDVLIANIDYQGYAEFEESVAAVFLVVLNVYYDEIGWGDYVPFYAVIERTAGNDDWLAVLGISYDVVTDRSIEAIVLEAAYNLWDVDASVKFDGFSEYAGPGSRYIFLNEDHETEFHFDYEPTYGEGDYWLSYQYDGMYVLVYHNQYEGYDVINQMEITRDDAETYRGIRVGSTRAEVYAAYPDIFDKPYWGWEGDYLWHNKYVDDYLEGFGISLIFWFTDDKVSKIEMLNMFD